MLHSVCDYSEGDLFKSLISLFLVVNEDVLKKVDQSGSLLIHKVAQNETLPTVKYLLNIYPESALITSNRINISHFAMLDDENDTAVVEEQVSYKCRQYPDLIHARDNLGFTPLHRALHSSSFKGVSAICQIYEQMLRDQTLGFRHLSTIAFATS